MSIRPASQVYVEPLPRRALGTETCATLTNDTDILRRQLAAGVYYDRISREQLIATYVAYDTRRKAACEAEARSRFFAQVAPPKTVGLIEPWVYQGVKPAGQVTTAEQAFNARYAGQLAFGLNLSNWNALLMYLARWGITCSEFNAFDPTTRTIIISNSKFQPGVKWQDVAAGRAPNQSSYVTQLWGVGLTQMCADMANGNPPPGTVMAGSPTTATTTTTSRTTTTSPPLTAPLPPTATSTSTTTSRTTTTAPPLTAPLPPQTRQTPTPACPISAAQTKQCMVRYGFAPKPAGQALTTGTTWGDGLIGLAALAAAGYGGYALACHLRKGRR